MEMEVDAWWIDGKSGDGDGDRKDSYPRPGTVTHRVVFWV
jgi:hypothetical protein